MDYSEDFQNFYLNEQNKKKRKELEEKYGADFHKPEDSEVPPEIENKFLKNIEEFERQHENAKYIKVIELIGNPKFKNVDEFPDETLADAIDGVLDLYAKHSINIDIIEEEEVSDKDFYIFLTEELPKEETEDIKIPGWTTNYIYEEFHPSDKLDAKQAVEDVLFSAISKDREFGPTFIANKKLVNLEGKPVTKDEFLEILYSLFENIEEVIEREFQFKSFEFDKKNLVDVDFIVRHKEKNSSVEIDKIFDFTFELLRSEYGGMEIISYRLNKS